MADALETILTAKRRRLAEAKEFTPVEHLERRVKALPPPVDFFSALNRAGAVTVIAEMKKRSPSAGVIREDYDIAAIAGAYERGGAHALSVLTEQDSFAGELEDLELARAASRLPILRKDFIFDPYQIVEARAHRADAVLLIADMLTAKELKELVAQAARVEIEPLVEIFTEAALPAAINSGARLIGINTRNLRTLEMFPDNVVSLSRLVPRDRLVVAESGIKTANDVGRLKAIRVGAVLVGESLLKQGDTEQAVRVLVEAGA